MTGKTNRVQPGRGEAGRSGDGVRSDLHVVVEAGPTDGLDLEIGSKVEAYFGDALRDQIGETLRTLGVDKALVRVDDRGALPFVVQARAEAAAREAGFGADADARPPRGAELPPPSAKNRLRRSRLYIPGNEPKFMVNAGLYGSDGVILDLEDSVHPGAKHAARYLVRNALRCIDLGGERMVRINQLPLGLDDLKVVVPELPDLILIPKVESPDQVVRVDEEISALLDAAGEDRPLWLMPILESGLGVERAFEIAGSSERVAALTIGLEDYTADLGVVKTVEGTESWFARARLVNAAKAAGVQAIDSVFGDVADAEGLRDWCRRSRALGFEGMGCIHPRQIPVIHEGYAPTRAEIDKALRIVQAFREAEEKGLGVVSLGSKMIDPPVVERARRLVEQAEAMGLVGDDAAEDKERQS
jgi:citrate lyase subunit beta/citryl-CoA lyase